MKFNNVYSKVSEISRLLQSGDLFISDLSIRCVPILRCDLCPFCDSIMICKKEVDNLNKYENLLKRLLKYSPEEFL